jgi:transcriptional regulator with XRE-family HTH domain
MNYDIDFSVANSAQIILTLGKRVEKIRLGRNWTREKLADEAGITARTVANLESGNKVTLDTLVRVLIALGVQANLQNLLPDPSIRPMERLRAQSTERRRARQNKANPSKEWNWNESEEEGG